MFRVKSLIRTVLAAALYYSGLLWVIAAVRLRGHAAVLMYHRVLPEQSDTFSHHGIIVSPETFERHMRFLSRHFRLLTPAEFRTELTVSGFGRRRCLITFDDGWQDNITHALPVLQRHRVPAVVFVATGYVGTDKTFWQERLTRLLYLTSRVAPRDDDPLVELGAANMRGMADAAARTRAREIVSGLKTRDPAVIEKIIARLEDSGALPSGRMRCIGDDRFLSWDEVATLQRSGIVTIGSHAHSHIPLPKLGVARALMELSRSRDELARHGLPRPDICAYPNGNVDDAVELAAREAGFSVGFATGHGRVGNGTNPMRLRRINVHDRSSATNAEFLCLIAGVL